LQVSTQAFWCRHNGRANGAIILSALFLLALATASSGQKVRFGPNDTSSPVDAAFFTRQVQPLLEQRCLGCHGVGVQLSHLDLRTRQSALQGGTRGAAFVPGDAQKSLLYKLVTGVRAPAMPPSGKLPAHEIQILRRWLDGGAPWAGNALQTAQKQVWWAFKPPVLPLLPSTRFDPWAHNPIDAFVLAQLQAAGLKPSPPAARRVLIRRAYQDLIGLPPTPEEVSAFETDRSPDAWEKVVDHLLASPHYGERWGRHWLDLVRYADSGGFEGDKDRPLAWRYRDYVIDAFNRDKPYNQFIREQLAGDELRPDGRDAIIATGYLACGPQDIVEMNERTRSNELDDLVATTGSVFLGLTVGCARCHDHKYDPIKQSDYYRLSAIFAPTERRELAVPTPEQRDTVENNNARVDQELAPLRARSEPLRQKGIEAAKHAGQVEPNDEQILKALSDTDRKALADLLAARKPIEARRMDLPRAMAVTDRGRTWDKCYLLVRGDAYHKGDEVQPGFICSLPGGAEDIPATAATANTTGRRRALADWIASPQNPLTARVWINRVWRQHFGRGLVNTPSNFGISGDLPSHPELLDWLALQFQAGDWRLKPIQRLILLSNTYRQCSDIRPEGMARDPQNRLYWRMPLRRLEAEPIRDSILAVAGTLNTEMGGPPVYPPVDPSLRADTFQGINWPEGEDSPKTWRRSVYVKVKRSLLLPELDVFDCPEITNSVAERNVTTTPLQALTLLNAPLILRQADLFAARLQRECGDHPQRWIVRAYRLAFSRLPTAQETRLALEFMRQCGPTALKDFCHAILNLNEFVYVP
jgi:hypothetical protein